MIRKPAYGVERAPCAFSNLSCLYLHSPAYCPSSTPVHSCWQFPTSVVEVEVEVAEMEVEVEVEVEVAEMEVEVAEMEVEVEVEVAEMEVEAELQPATSVSQLHTLSSWSNLSGSMQDILQPQPCRSKCSLQRYCGLSPASTGRTRARRRPPGSIRPPHSRCGPHPAG